MRNCNLFADMQQRNVLLQISLPFFGGSTKKGDWGALYIWWWRRNKSNGVFKVSMKVNSGGISSFFETSDPSLAHF